MLVRSVFVLAFAGSALVLFHSVTLHNRPHLWDERITWSPDGGCVAWMGFCALVRRFISPPDGLRVSLTAPVLIKRDIIMEFMVRRRIRITQSPEIWLS